MDEGVSDAFDEWVEARAAALLRFAYLVTGSQHEAEEAVQAALTRALEKWSRVQRTTDPDQYVRRMIVNEHISGWRRGRRRELPVAQVRETAYADPADSVAGSDVVWRVCSSLPRQQRAAVVLRYYEDLEYAEIAALLEVSEVSARSYVHRALAAMRVELERQEQVDG